MELELGFKITKAIDDIRSTDLRIAKDQGGLIFVARETETKFILTAHLKGYKRDHISISINEDGTLLTIKGERPIQEMVMRGWVMYKGEPELRGFEKIFKIPHEAILDKIKAKYNDDESTLTIYMPKHSKGITGQVIEELVKEHPNHNNDDETREEIEHENEEEDDQNGDDRMSREGQIQLGQYESEMVEGESKEDEEYEGYGSKGDGKISKLFGPCFFVGSALIASLVVLVVGLVRSKKQRNETN